MVCKYICFQKYCVISLFDIIPNIYADSNNLDMFIISHDTDVCKLACSCIHLCIGGSVGGQNCLPFISMVWLWHCTQFCD